MAKLSLIAAAFVAAVLFEPVHAVDRSKFKTCALSGFCKRHRDRTSEPELHITPGTISVDPATATLSATLLSAAPGAPPFDLRIHFYASGVARVRVLERDDKPPRWEVSDVIYSRYVGCVLAPTKHPRRF
jgi:hypothetical protein